MSLASDAKYFLAMRATYEVLYPERYMALKNEEVLGDYATAIEAMLDMAKRGHAIDSYIVRNCGSWVYRSSLGAVAEAYYRKSYQTLYSHSVRTWPPRCAGCSCHSNFPCPNPPPRYNSWGYAHGGRGGNSVGNSYGSYNNNDGMYSINSIGENL